MGEKRYVVMLPKGQESDFLSMTDLYDWVRQKRIRHDSMVFDKQTNVWQEAWQYPTLCTLFNKISSEEQVERASRRAMENPQPPPPPENFWSKLKTTFARH